MFVGKYMELEKFMFRWVRVPEKRSDDLIEERILDASIKQFGQNNPGDSEGDEGDFLEFHVDLSEILHKFISTENQKFGGDLSINFPQGEKLNHNAWPG